MDDKGYKKLGDFRGNLKSKIWIKYMKHKVNISTKKKNLGKPMKNTRRKPRRNQMGGANKGPIYVEAIVASSNKILLETLISLEAKEPENLDSFIANRFNLILDESKEGDPRLKDIENVKLFKVIGENEFKISIFRLEFSDSVIFIILSYKDFNYFEEGESKNILISEAIYADEEYKFTNEEIQNVMDSLY